MKWDPRYKVISNEPSIPGSGCSDVSIVEVCVGDGACLAVGDPRGKVCRLCVSWVKGVECWLFCVFVEVGIHWLGGALF